MIFRLQRGLRDDLRLLWSHSRDRGWRETLHWLKSPDTPVTFQFLKYAALGLLTTFVHVGLFTWFSHIWFPSHDYLVAGGLPDELKERNAILSNLLAFPLAAILNYVVNVLFVFKSGRHSRLGEFLLFIGVSFASFGAGLLSGPLLISRGLDPWIAQGGLVVTSTMINFICRKFIVFQK